MMLNTGLVNKMVFMSYKCLMFWY